MIEYEFSESSIFTANKEYIESILIAFDPEQYKTEGYCSSYGYEVTICYEKLNLIYTFRFKKTQSTQGGGLFFHPIAIDSSQLELIVAGFDTKNKINFGKSRFGRLFMNSKIKSIVSAPFYYQTNLHFEKAAIKSQLNLFKEHFIDSLKLKTGKMKCKIYLVRSDLLQLRTTLETMAQIYATHRQ